MMLLNTKVKRWDGACVYFPNSVLDTNPLINLSRSDNKWEFFKVRRCSSGLPNVLGIPNCRSQLLSKSLSYYYLQLYVVS